MWVAVISVVFTIIILTVAGLFVYGIVKGIKDRKASLPYKTGPSNSTENHCCRLHEDSPMNAFWDCHSCDKIDYQKICEHASGGAGYCAQVRGCMWDAVNRKCNVMPNAKIVAAEGCGSNTPRSC